ncbi:facilitated trehalose transporter Tret1-2 homolog [Anopheles albimanus]|uniref:Major facilitator superfamily (MFS) profile domain-containing protein n=1 Tax=Anopheles albimanus TaxID=7167 RepID=A0A182FW58_ANOAL|nr:facilitated trehalose transporter Tret1-2 homolog [Anopheles albimanus]
MKLPESHYSAMDDERTTPGTPARYEDHHYASAHEASPMETNDNHRQSSGTPYEKKLLLEIESKPEKRENEVKVNGEAQEPANRDLSEAVSSSTMGGVFHQLLLTSAVLLLAAACGMPIGYSAVLLPQLYDTNESLAIDIEMGSWIASVHSLATPIGSFASGPIMDRWGRRPALLLAIIPLFTGWVLLATASSHFLLLLGRMVAGVSVGLIAAPAQVLLAEIAEPRLRGLLIGAPFVAYSLGILLVYALGSQLHWRAVAWGGTVLPALSFVALYFAPESPTWLARNSQQDRASKALTWLRGCPIAAKKELHKLTERFEQEQEQERLDGSPQSFWHSLKEIALIKPLVIINGFHVLQILSGTYLVVFYAVDLISDLGGSDINTIQAAVLTAIVRLAFTFLYCFLLLLMPRRSMVCISGLISGASCIAIAIFMYVRSGEAAAPYDTYIAAVLILIYIGSNTGFLTMPGIMIGELLPAKIRGQIAGYLFTVFNLLLFGVAKGFPHAKAVLKTQGLFVMFGVASFGASLLMYLLLPETKGRTLHDIEDYFGQRNWLWMTRQRKETTSSAPRSEDTEGQPLKANVSST